MSLLIPSDLIQRFSNASSASGRVRVIAYLYYKVDHLFPKQWSRKGKKYWGGRDKIQGVAVDFIEMLIILGN